MTKLLHSALLGFLFALPASAITPGPELVVKQDRERILVAAEKALVMKPVSLTQHRSPLNPGTANEFFSMSDYYWPDPAKPDGKPYIMRDGQSNPGNFNEHRMSLMAMRDATSALAAAFLLTRDEKHAQKAVEMLRVFFLDAETRMTPSLEHAQAIVGLPTPNRGTGLIDTLHLIEVPLSILALRESKAMTPEVFDALRQWFADYTTWFIESSKGKNEAKAKNNHAVAYWTQVAAFATLTQDAKLLEECRRQFKEVFIGVQMGADGGFPLELGRTKPYAYSIFQLDIMSALSVMLSTPQENLWRFTTPDGRGMERAMAFLHPFLKDKASWPKAPDVNAWEGWPVRQPALLLGGLAFAENKYLDLWRELKPDPQAFEIRRNNAITQPLLWTSLFGSKFVAAAPARRPNVLFIAIDDLKPALGCYGDPHAKTPNLDRLASRSLRLERAYCNQAVCAPSRNSLMTGLRPQALGIYDLSTNFRDARPDSVTLAQHFKNNGYHTTVVGKILHTGHGNHDDPESWSEKPVHPKTDYYALPENQPPADENAKGKEQRGSPTESADVPDDTYADGLIAAEAVKKLAAVKASNAPFFLAVGFLKPHLPFVAPKKYWDLIDDAKLPLPSSDTLPKDAPEAAGPSTDELRKYKGIPQGKEALSEAQKRQLIHGYYAAMSYADACVGRVLDALESSGLADNTIIVIWGDHGYHLGDHGIWGKHTNFETAARIPLMIAMPGKKGDVSSALVETVDIYPTLAALTGLPEPQALDGRSFATLFDDPTAAHRDHVTHVYPRRELLGRAVRDERYRLVEWNKIGAAPETATFELYDYQTDSLERKNLASAQPEVLARLKALLAKQPAALPQVKAKTKPTASAPTAGKMSREEMFKGKDKDGDGKLTREEFLRHQRDPEEAPKRFDRFDTNHDGVLVESEFVKAGTVPVAN